MNTQITNHQTPIAFGGILKKRKAAFFIYVSCGNQLTSLLFYVHIMLLKCHLPPDTSNFTVSLFAPTDAWSRDPVHSKGGSLMINLVKWASGMCPQRHFCGLMHIEACRPLLSLLLQNKRLPEVYDPHWNSVKTSANVPILPYAPSSKSPINIKSN